MGGKLSCLLEKIPLFCILEGFQFAIIVVLQIKDKLNEV
ncbi:hypothetical protein Ga0466249_005243 [Sporomusaceae bacterium BoRhaA]|nr:hypothetical protein [Pelorhabdus rhamnosifermentans]